MFVRSCFFLSFESYRGLCRFFFGREVEVVGLEVIVFFLVFVVVFRMVGVFDL